MEVTGNVSEACRRANLARRTAYNWRNHVEGFKTQWEEAFELGVDALEDEAIRRAAEGTKRKKFTANGAPVIDPETGEQYFKHDYSDTLLIFMLKARRPEKFRERNETLHGSAPGKPIEIIEIIRNKPRELPVLRDRQEADSSG